jgi:RimJ/RimL family protein N-acetyltransferase
MFKLIKNEKRYYEFIRLLRTDSNNIDGFLEKVSITPQQQESYMEKYSACYFICLENDEPVGFIGVVDDDIRVCTHHLHKKRGVGHFMLKEITKMYPEAKAKILKENVASLKLFERCGYQIIGSDEFLYYLKYQIK